MDTGRVSPSLCVPSSYSRSRRTRPRRAVIADRGNTPPSPKPKTPKKNGAVVARVQSLNELSTTPNSKLFDVYDF